MSLERRYVVQEHEAKRAKKHHDLRLMKGGVMKSWAVPKGIPLAPNDKRLAVQTADHSKHWMTFEGKIPKGQYGYGTVKIWDKGNYKAQTWKRDRIKVNMNGKKMKGEYVLYRLKGDKWIIFKVKKHADEKNGKA